MLNFTAKVVIGMGYCLTLVIYGFSVSGLFHLMDTQPVSSALKPVGSVRILVELEEMLNGEKELPAGVSECGKYFLVGMANETIALAFVMRDSASAYHVGIVDYLSLQTSRIEEFDTPFVLVFKDKNGGEWVRFFLAEKHSREIADCIMSRPPPRRFRSVT
jgi:hypothetical protein